MNFFNKLPRFQFFHDTGVLILSFFELFFADVQKVDQQEKFLEKVKSLFNRRHAHLISSYRMGLYFTLKSLGLNKGDEVLLSPLTIADTVNAITLSGLTPVFVDMDLDTQCICLDDLQAKKTNRSKVLLITYLSGIVPEVDELSIFAKTHGLVVVEDISQNMDASYKNRKIGSHGDVSIASLSCGKNISTLYGGLVLTDSEGLMRKIKALSDMRKIKARKDVLFYYLINSIKVQLATSRYVFALFVYPLLKILSFFKRQYPVDFNHDPIKKQNIFRSYRPESRQAFPDDFYVSVNDWQLSLVDHQLRKLSQGTAKRRELARVLLQNLSDKSCEYIPQSLYKIKENSFYHFPIYCGGKKAELRKYLFAAGIDSGSYGLNLCTDEEKLGFVTHLPKAKAIKHDSLFLPLHESHDFKQMEYLASVVNSYFDKNHAKYPAQNFLRKDKTAIPEQQLK